MNEDAAALRETPLADAALPDPERIEREADATTLPAPGERLGGADRIDRIHRRDSAYRRLLAFADVCAVTISLLGSVYLLGDDAIAPLALLVPFGLVLVAKMLGLYDRDAHLIHKTTLEEVPALFGIATLAVLLLWLSGDAIVEGNIGRRQVIGSWLLMFALIVVGRAAGRKLAQRLTPVERCLFIGDPKAGAPLTAALRFGRAGATVIASVNPPTGDGWLHDRQLHRSVIEAIDEHDPDRIILSPGDSSSDEILFTVRELKDSGARVSVLPQHPHPPGSAIELDHVAGVTLLGIRRFEFSRSSRLVKRGFDVAASALGLLAILPLLIVVAIAVKLDSRGPVLFRQERIGRDGRRFQMLKLRSMFDGADSDKDGVRHLSIRPEGLFKIPRDPRLTRVGRLIRQVSIDELPQLVNVLKGDMSLVGPRPLIPEEDVRIEGAYRRRLDLPPGITGHWQVLGSTRVPLEEMVRLDYLYVANWSLWGDIVLLLRTLPVVFGRRGV